MNWVSDPPHPWVAAYRVAVLVLSIIGVGLQFWISTKAQQAIEVLAKVTPTP